MIISLDTSTPTCLLGIYIDGMWHESQWEAGRELASGLLTFLTEELERQQGDLHSLTGIIAYKGPGSFTGLRIGLTVLNTIADSTKAPIVGETNDTWRTDGLARLTAGENDHLVMPLYGSEPHITTPRK